MKKSEVVEAIKFLEDNEYLEYGKIIPLTIVEKVIGEAYGNNWNFLGKFLHLKMSIEEEGYLCRTEESLPGCIIIYNADEIAHKVNNIQKNMVRKLKRLQNCLLGTNVTQLNRRDYSKHLHLSSKVTAGLQSLKSVLSTI